MSSLSSPLQVSNPTAMRSHIHLSSVGGAAEVCFVEVVDGLEGAGSWVEMAAVFVAVCGFGDEKDDALPSASPSTNTNDPLSTNCVRLTDYI